MEAALQQIKGFALADDAAARGHHHAFGVVFGNPQQRAPLVTAVTALPVQQQNFVHAGARFAFNFAVQLNKGHTARRGQLRPQRRFTSAAQADQRDAPLASPRISEPEGTSQHFTRLVELRIIQIRQQPLNPGQRRARCILQQFEDRNVQRAGNAFQRIDRHIALA